MARTILSLHLSLFALLIGNSIAFGQTGVVVPTVPSDSTTPSNPPSSTPTQIPSPNNSSTTRFSCQYYDGKYTVMYQPQSQPGRFFAWAIPQSLGAGWNPQNRCQAIASRLELYRPDGLQELQIARQNNENIICVTTEAVSTCRIVLTVPRSKDPYAVRSSIFSNLTAADQGQQTIGVNTYTNSPRRSGNNPHFRGGINLKPFLSMEDGGTGTNLNNGLLIRSRTPGKTILNPRLFR
ncbi:MULTISPECIES: COP23 domain-containing protein [Cylindrospermopsis]|uniref:COP23 domain-containing protein n=1 Tax=Cylindrospermopsis TaxID=77021 RepID=UPI0007110178|nr:MULTISPECIES: COP23 domain-containing protein [Cylindrospermopsis]KRH98330.1 hypothetical protein ASL19_12515 [Cylindrospermopsis sp. CR12]MBU6345732.1 hypothetical protein [Cyanobacteria bacterium REEB494]TPX28942.1 hypothetical protein FIV49_00415 [Cylindrospermopsis raciborskii GIHE 2018]